MAGASYELHREGPWAELRLSPAGRVRAALRLFAAVFAAVFAGLAAFSLPDFVADLSRHGTGYSGFFAGYLVSVAFGVALAVAIWRGQRRESWRIDARTGLLRWQLRSLGSSDELEWEMGSLRGLHLERRRFPFAHRLWLRFPENTLRLLAHSHDFGELEAIAACWNELSEASRSGDEDSDPQGRRSARSR